MNKLLELFNAIKLEPEEKISQIVVNKLNSLAKIKQPKNLKSRALEWGKVNPKFDDQTEMTLAKIVWLTSGQEQFLKTSKYWIFSIPEDRNIFEEITIRALKSHWLMAYSKILRDITEESQKNLILSEKIKEFIKRNHIEFIESPAGPSKEKEKEKEREQEIEPSAPEESRIQEEIMEICSESVWPKLPLEESEYQEIETPMTRKRKLVQIISPPRESDLEPRSIHFPFLNELPPPGIFSSCIRRSCLESCLITSCIGVRAMELNNMPPNEAWMISDKEFFIPWITERLANFPQSKGQNELLTGIMHEVQSLRREITLPQERPYLASESRILSAISDLTEQIYSSGIAKPLTEQLRPIYTPPQAISESSGSAATGPPPSTDFEIPF